MVALLVGLSIMAVTLSVALPTWRTMAQREREAELVFRGQQYARAITLYQRKFANAFPPNLDMLVEQRFLRRKYVDPVTGGEFQILYVGEATPGQGAAPAGGAGAQTGIATQLGRGGTAAAPAGTSATPLGGRAGIMGVSSKSTGTSIREYNGRTKYNEWTFVAVQASTRAGGAGGSQTPTGGVGGSGGRGAGPQTTGSGGRGQPTDGGARRGGGNQPFGGPQSGPSGPRGGRF